MPQNNKPCRLDYPREPIARVPVDLAERDGCRTETGQSRAREASGESSMQLAGGRTEILKEAFGHGRLVRPKVGFFKCRLAGVGALLTVLYAIRKASFHHTKPSL